MDCIEYPICKNALIRKSNSLEDNRERMSLAESILYGKMNEVPLGAD